MTCLCGDCRKCGYDPRKQAERESELESENARLRKALEAAKSPAQKKREKAAGDKAVRDVEVKELQAQMARLRARLKKLGAGS